MYSGEQNIPAMLHPVESQLSQSVVYNLTHFITNSLRSPTSICFGVISLKEDNKRDSLFMKVLLHDCGLGAPDSLVASMYSARKTVLLLA